MGHIRKEVYELSRAIHIGDFVSNTFLHVLLIFVVSEELSVWFSAICHTGNNMKSNLLKATNGFRKNEM